MDYTREHWKYMLIGTLVLCAGLIWYSVQSQKPRQRVTVSFLSVGEGDAALIQGKSGEQVLIGAGPNRDTLTALGKALPFFDRTLDLVIELYPDNHNTGGIPDVLNRFTVHLVAYPNQSVENTIDDEIQRIVREKEIKVLAVSAGTQIKFREGSLLTVLSAKAGKSTILKYEYGNTCFLFMGSSGGGDEGRFIDEHGDVHCQVLVAGSHGSKSATSEALLRTVKPEYAVFSNSKDNRYEYPDPEVFERLKVYNVQALNTLDNGTITFESDGKNIWTK